MKSLMILFIGIIVALAIQFVVADELVVDYRLVQQHPRSSERVTNFDPRVQTYGWEETVDLEPPGQQIITGESYSETRQPRGTGRVSSQNKFISGNPQAGATIKVRHLAPTYNGNQRYEGWLIDEDTGYWLTFGVFATDHFGNGRLNTATYSVGGMPEKQKIYHSLELYDALAVTLEPYPDDDPRPSENVVLYGKIPRKYHEVTPEPTVQQKVWGLNKYIPSQTYGNVYANLPRKAEPVPLQIKPPSRKFVYDTSMKKWLDVN